MIMTVLRNTVFILLVLTLGCNHSEGQEINARFEISEAPPVKVKEGQAYTFGYLQVPENRNKANSNTIQLPVYIFKSRSKTPKPDPVIYLVGGPGSSIMGAVPYMNYYQYLDDRDFILLEQRGTTYAQPHLACPEWAEAVFQSRLPGRTAEQSDSLFRQAALDCRDRLLAEDIDLNGYNTREIAADVEALRQVLNIEQYNLLTLSYGTKIAQTLLRDYPEGIRSVVMDSPLPLEVNYDEESVGNLLESWELIFRDCQKDPECKKAFPDLKERFFQFLEEKTNRPQALTVTNPDTGEEETFYLRGKDIFLLLSPGSTYEVAGVPGEVHKVLTGDWSTIEEMLASLFEGPGNGAGMGMRLSVWCAEEMPFNNRKKVEEESKAYPAIKGLSPAVFQPEICDLWGVKSVPSKENQAVKSDVPVLLISGEYDNETPVKWAQQMQQNLSNSHHLIFKGWHHTPTTYWNNPCGMNAANAFFNNPSKKPELDCLEKIKSPKFKMFK
jgi:pimeloyl-ACP methyl ester carboxylesterase